MKIVYRDVSLTKTRVSRTPSQLIISQTDIRTDIQTDRQTDRQTTVIAVATLQVVSVDISIRNGK